MTTNETKVEEQDNETAFEYQIFALCFREPGAIEKFADNLPEYMVGAIHGDSGINEFYKTFLHFYEKTGLEQIDPVAWKAWLQSESDIYQALGGEVGVKMFVDICMKMELSTVDSVIKVLKHRANQRVQMNSLQKLQTLLNQKGSKDEEELQQINELTSKIRDLENDLNLDPLTKVSTGFDIADRAEGLMELPSFLSTPFPDYNRALGYTEQAGYFRGAVHAIIAMSGHGKSTLAKCLTNHWLDQGYSCLYINFEEAQDHWERILMTQIIRENVYAHAANWDEVDKHERMQIFKKKLEEWGNRFMIQHDPSSSYFDDLEVWLRDIMGHGHYPDVVVIDTIQSMFLKGKSSGGQRWNEYEQMMVRLEKLAKDMNAVFVITSQQNSNAAKEKREVVEQQDAGGSLTIVQKASVSTFMVRHKDSTGDPSLSSNLTELQIVKNRITGEEFRNNPPRIQYLDEVKSYIPYVESQGTHEVQLDDDPYYFG